jgi:hypothetical protein
MQVFPLEMAYSPGNGASLATDGWFLPGLCVELFYQIHGEGGEEKHGRAGKPKVAPRSM